MTLDEFIEEFLARAVQASDGKLSRADLLDFLARRFASQAITARLEEDPFPDAP